MHAIDYRPVTCTNCQHQAVVNTFCPLFPLTDAEREAGIAAGATIPDPPLVPDPCFLCPSCKRLVQIVDDDGHLVAPERRSDRLSVVEQAERVARLATGRSDGRVRHGGSVT